MSFTRDGVYRWDQRFGSAGTESAFGLAVDPVNGFVYVGGKFDQTIDFGGGPIGVVGTSNAFIAAFTLDGTYRWSRSLGDTGDNRLDALAVDASGNIYATGYYDGTPSFGGAAITSYGTVEDLFVVSLDSNGNHRWSSGYGGPEIDWGKAIAAGPDGNVYMAGVYQGTATFGGGQVSAPAINDGIIASYDWRVGCPTLEPSASGRVRQGTGDSRYPRPASM